MVRIITGIAKNKKLKAPNNPEFRAVQDVAKGSLFSIIGEKVVDSQCLDLFAGSGNLGIEALSRGASYCDFVEQDKTSSKIIQDNIDNCGFSNNSEVISKSAVKYAGNTEKKYDIIFVDPFYHDTSHIFLTTNLEEILNPDGLIIFFHGDNLDIDKIKKDTNLKQVDQRRFGKSFFTILSH